jgi:hypothetical protein
MYTHVAMVCVRARGCRAYAHAAAVCVRTCFDVLTHVAAFVRTRSFVHSDAAECADVDVIPS